MSKTEGRSRLFLYLFNVGTPWLFLFWPAVSSFAKPFKKKKKQGYSGKLFAVVIIVQANM